MYFPNERVIKDLYGELKDISRYVIKLPWKEREMLRKSSVR